ncbi:MAG: DNA-3-methyladenine glycosylase 2 family protein [Sulfitobacter sp.]
MSLPARIITGPQDLEEGTAWLAANVAGFADVLAQTGPLPLRLKPAGFGGLLEIIISQQVSVASANAIRERMTQAGLVCQTAVRDAGIDGLRAAGLSRPKARYALALAQAALDYDALSQMPDDAVIAVLCEQLGIGPWTAQIYVMFCLGRADAFPPGDLALQESARRMFDLPARPDAPLLDAMSQEWSPWRSVAARALFAYYRILKNREGLG